MDLCSVGLGTLKTCSKPVVTVQICRNFSRYLPQPSILSNRVYTRFVHRTKLKLQNTPLFDVNSRKHEVVKSRKQEVVTVPPQTPQLLQGWFGLDCHLGRSDPGLAPQQESPAAPYDSDPWTDQVKIQPEPALLPPPPSPGTERERLVFSAAINLVPQPPDQGHT